MNKNNSIVVPGEVITTEEEFVAGKNTFAENGLVKATSFGKADFDNDLKEVSIKGPSIQKLAVGDIIIGRVDLVKESAVVINIIQAEKNKKMSLTKAQLPIRNVSNVYTSNLRSLFKIGDLVKARVTAANELIVDLATNEKGLGVLMAYCSKCREKMSFSNGKMMCLACGNVEERKWFEQEEPERTQHGDRDRSFDRGDRNDRGNRWSGPRGGREERSGGFGDRGNRRSPGSNRRSFSNKGNFRGGRR